MNRILLQSVFAALALGNEENTTETTQAVDSTDSQIDSQTVNTNRATIENGVQEDETADDIPDDDSITRRNFEAVKSHVQSTSQEDFNFYLADLQIQYLKEQQPSWLAEDLENAVSAYDVEFYPSTFGFKSSQALDDVEAVTRKDTDRLQNLDNSYSLGGVYYCTDEL